MAKKKRPGTLSREYLEQLQYERSMRWANLLENLAKVKDEDEISLSKLTDYYGSDNEDDEQTGEGCEEGEEEDSMKMRKVSRKAHKNCKKADEEVEAEEAEDLGANGDSRLDTEMEDLLNQTKPVVQALDRRWKEAGMDRVLDTFDSQKIEEKVGSWLQRNRDYDHTTTGSRRRDDNKYHTKEDSDSLHSGDTARYIRSSRKKRYKGASTCTATMTIKTFRLVKSKRDELRRKYATNSSSRAATDYDQDVEAQAHFDVLRGRRAQRCRYQQQQNQTSGSKLVPRVAVADHSRGRRRKQLRKRRPSHGTYSSSHSCTSSTSNCGSNDESLISARPAAKAVRNRSGRKPGPSHDRHRSRTQHDDSGASDASPLLPSRRNLRNIQRSLKLLQSQVADVIDRRPRKRESECNCGNDAKLCKNARHSADTAKKPQRKSKLPPRASKMERSKSEQSKKQKPQKNDPLPKTVKKKAEKAKKSEKFEKVQNTKLKQKSKEPNKISRGSLKEEKRTETKKASPKKPSLSDSIFISSEEAPGEKMPKQQPKLAKLRKVAKKEKAAMEETLVAQARNIRNSTAMDKDGTAKKQQLRGSASLSQVDKTINKAGTKNVAASAKKSVKRVAAASTTRTTSDSSSSQVPPPNAQPKGNHTHSDCTKVSSTTDNPQLQFKSEMPSAPATSQQQQQNPQTQKLTSISSHLNTPKGILLYSPSNPGSAPAHIFSGDYFNITLEHLIAVIGEKKARKFFKYYVGRRRFNRSSTIYYRPPEPTDSSSSSEEDVLEALDKCGSLYEVINLDHGGAKK